MRQQSIPVCQDPGIWQFEPKKRHPWLCLGHPKNALERNSSCYPEIFASGFIFWDEMPQDPAKSAPSLAPAQTGPFSQHIPFMDNEASFLFIHNNNNNIRITWTSFGGFSGNPPQKYHVPKQFSGIPWGSSFKDCLTPHLLELCPAKLLYYDTTCFLGIPLHVLTLVAFALFPWHPKV